MNPQEVREKYRRREITLAQARDALGMWLVIPEELDLHRVTYFPSLSELKLENNE